MHCMYCLRGHWLNDKAMPLLNAPASVEHLVRAFTKLLCDFCSRSVVNVHLPLERQHRRLGRHDSTLCPY
eukprot:5502789-Amphidinium_carterae.2